MLTKVKSQVHIDIFFNVVNFICREINDAEKSDTFLLNLFICIKRQWICLLLVHVDIKFI